MKKHFLKELLSVLALLLLVAPKTKAEGEYAWPAQYGGVMLQGFYWDSYDDSNWTNLSAQAGELSDYFDLIWVPNSGKCSSDPSMGYNPVYWFTNHNSSFGTESELREMIKTFKMFGTGIIEDVVVNHRDGVSTWTDFPTETYNGVTYEWGPWAICQDDEVAGAEGQETPTGAKDTGDNFDGCRDLDHTNAKVQEGIKAYLDFLKNDLGYAGWRYDMVKGYGGEFVGMYNESAKAAYSVGEFWDNYDAITAWIEKTNRQSAAFDFPFKYAANEAFSSRDYSKLVWARNGSLNQPAGLVHMDTYQRYAVTFIDNHDTYRDGSKFTGDVVAANAYMLCSPGTPCVFFMHWLQNKNAIKKLIEIRKSVGITNQSSVTVLEGTQQRYVAKVTGSKGELVIKIGLGSYTPAGYTEDDRVANNSFYGIWTKTPIEALETLHPEVTFSPDGGYYAGGVTVTLTAENVAEGKTASIAYTTDGSTPSVSNGTKVASGTNLDITANTTLKAVVIVDNEVVSAVKTATYKTKREPVVVYLMKPEWSTVNFYAWGDEIADTDLLGKWPGTTMTETVTVKDTEWYSYAAPEQYDRINIIFNNGTDQTVNIEDVEGTHFYKLDATSGKTITVTDVTDEYYEATVSNAVAETAVSVYPNPATETVYVNAAKEVAAIRVYAASGALAAQSAGASSVDVAGLQPGFYLYRILFADGTAAQGKIVKK